MKTYQRSHIATKNNACYDTNEVEGDSMNNKKVGKFIAQARRKKKLTQAQLGEMLGLSDKAISKWERGINGPDVSVLQSLSDALGVSIAEILLGQEIKTTITNEEVNNYTLSGIGFYKKIFRRRYTRIIGILIGIILLITIGFSCLYMFTNYNKVQVYGLKSASDEITFNGLLVKNQKENSIIISDFKYNENGIGSKSEPKVISLSTMLKINDIVIFSKNKEIEPTKISNLINEINVTINESKIVSKYSLKRMEKSKMIMTIKFKTSEERYIEYKLPIRIIKRFSNNKLVY